MSLITAATDMSSVAFSQSWMITLVLALSKKTMHMGCT